MDDRELLMYVGLHEEDIAEYHDAPGTLPPSLPYPQLVGTLYGSIVEYVESKIANENRLKRAVKLRRWRQRLINSLSLRKS